MLLSLLFFRSYYTLLASLPPSEISSFATVLVTIHSIVFAKKSAIKIQKNSLHIQAMGLSTVLIF
jgi:hypothetical protein